MDVKGKPLLVAAQQPFRPVPQKVAVEDIRNRKEGAGIFRHQSKLRGAVAKAVGNLREVGDLQRVLHQLQHGLCHHADDARVSLRQLLHLTTHQHGHLLHRLGEERAAVGQQQVMLVGLLLAWKRLIAVHAIELDGKAANVRKHVGSGPESAVGKTHHGIVSPRLREESDAQLFR